MSETTEFIQKAFWQLVGVVTVLFGAASSALVGVLWHLNGSVVILNERVGTVIEKQVRQESQNTRRDELLLDHSLQLQSLKPTQRRSTR